MSNAPTIAAVASGWAPADRALVRISGPGVRGVLAALVRPVPSRAWTVGRAGFRLTDRLESPVLVMWYAAPRTFTGEDLAELVVPGNPHLLERVMARLTGQPGVREARPGEFSARAFLNGRLSLAQAEGVAATIAAQTERELAAAEDLLTGRAGERHRGWVEELATLLALVEAGIDFTDQEDVVPIAPGALRSRVDGLRDRIREELGSASGGEDRAGHPRVVLVGPPNAGKSTLFNALLGRRRAVESPVAGTTRDALVEPLDLTAEAHGLGAARVLLIDLPGLDPDASGAIDRQAQARAREEIGRADVAVLCLPADAGSRARASMPPVGPGAPARPVIRVLTKADLPRAGEDDEGAIGVCALDGWHLPALRRAIADAAWTGGEGRGPFLLPRHRRAMARALERLSAAAAQIDPAAHALRTPETVADELRGGLDALTELSGQISPDDIIGRVFATFCIGK